MRKVKFFVPIMVAVALLVVMAVPVLADDPDEVIVNWDGTGLVSGSVSTGDATSIFATGGNTIVGSFIATDSNNNPYGYNVDSFVARLNASVAGGGYISMLTDRDTSLTSMYGPAGQESYSYVFTNDGSASMSVRTATNYASLIDPTYGYQLAGGHNIIVDGSYYEIVRRVLDGQGNGGQILADGDGSAVLDNMVSGASGNGGVRFGWGGGCYTDASYTATGSGYFEVTGVGGTSVTFEGLGISAGAGSLSIISNFSDGFNIDDYSLTAN